MGQWMRCRRTWERGEGYQGLPGGGREDGGNG